MQRPDPQGTGARDKSNTGKSFGDDAAVFSKFRAPVQALPQSEAEALAWGYGLPPADHLTACRAIWWTLHRLGVGLPIERRVILIAGGAV